MNALTILDDIYENMNIYHTLIILDDDEDFMLEELRKKDYPVCKLSNTNIDDIDDLEKSNRVFVLDIADLDIYMNAKKNDVTSITVIMCLTAKIYTDVCLKIIETPVLIAEQAYIFSCDIV